MLQRRRDRPIALLLCYVPLRRWAQTGALIVGALLCLPLAAKSEPAKIYLFAAASLQTPLEKITASFEKEVNVKVILALGGSGDLARQIAQGAPASLFISASSKWMDYLEERNLIAQNSRQNLIGNRLVVVASPCAKSPANGASIASLLASYPQTRIAMGNPDTVPAGTYARQALEKLGLWDQVAARAVFTEDVRAAVAWVIRCEADLGFVYESDAIADRPKGLWIAAHFAQDTHDRIVYPMAVIDSENEAMALELQAFLSSKESLGIFVENGFLILPETGAR